MSEQKINTNPISGFMELLPGEQILFNKIKEVIERNYKLFGFIPMDNPLIERKDILFAKAGGETEKQIYQFKKGDEELALRFDLTVPLARYVSNKYGKLTFPFKRYQIAKVYRGERPQAGRFREFYQADIDVIGDDNLSLDFDAEVIAIAIKIFQDLDLDATIRINNRKLFDGFFQELNLNDKLQAILIWIDKLEKIGNNEVMEGLKSLSINDDKINQIFDFISVKEIFELKNLNIKNKIFQEGIIELENVFKNLKELGVERKSYEFDLTIVRGLGYYTGTIYETRLNKNPEFGSICSGGRYENLASEYTDRKLPGVGISIGLSRLFDQLLKNNIIETGEKTYSKIYILPMNENEKEFSMSLISKMREKNIPAEIDLNFQKKISKRARYAEKLKIPYVLFIGRDEVKNNVFNLKNFQTGERIENLSESDLITLLKNSI